MGTCLNIAVTPTLITLILCFIFIKRVEMKFKEEFGCVCWLFITA